MDNRLTRMAQQLMAGIKKANDNDIPADDPKVQGSIRQLKQLMDKSQGTVSGIQDRRATDLQAREGRYDQAYEKAAEPYKASNWDKIAKWGGLAALGGGLAASAMGSKSPELATGLGMLAGGGMKHGFGAPRRDYMGKQRTLQNTLGRLGTQGALQDQVYDAQLGGAQYKAGIAGNAYENERARQAGLEEIRLKGDQANELARIRNQRGQSGIDYDKVPDYVGQMGDEYRSRFKDYLSNKQKWYDDPTNIKQVQGEDGEFMNVPVNAYPHAAPTEIDAFESVARGIPLGVSQFPEVFGDAASARDSIGRAYLGESGYDRYKNPTQPDVGWEGWRPKTSSAQPGSDVSTSDIDLQIKKAKEEVRILEEKVGW